MCIVSPRGARSPAFGLLATVALALVAGCYPGDVEDLSRSDIVATVHDEEADFQSLRTYAVADTVVDMAAEPGTPSTLDDDLYDQILESARSNMEALGYVEAQDPSAENPPDVVVTCSYATVDYTIWYYDPWCDWYGWYGYGCGGWGWYPGYDTVNFTAGTLVLNMFDLKHRDPESETVPMIWSAIGSGLLDGTTSTARIREVIDRSFDQSTYLRLRTGKVQ